MLGKKSSVESRGSSGEARVARREARGGSFSHDRNGARPRRDAARSSRRGVLLLVVLSMLVLFMLIGTAFLMSSSQQSKNAGNAAKLNSVGNPPTKDLDNALMQVLRDSDNEHSAIRYHSLLRDIYGTDGFQGVVDSATYARRIVVPPDPPTNSPDYLRGYTSGQFIDLYVVPPKPPIDNTSTTNIDESLTGLTTQHVLKLERDGLNRPQLYTLPLTKGYFNGGLMTITSGHAAGQSTRIVEYQFVGDDPAIANLFAKKADTTTIPGVSRIWRFRVMAFSQTDGQALNVATGSLPSPPAITDLTGASFIVNSRAFSGTGVGYNPFAVLGQPRLNAVETVLMGSDLTKALYPEVALTPNAAYFFPCDPDTNQSHTDTRGVRVPGIPGVPNSGGQPTNPKITTSMSAAQIATALSQWRYPTFAGPGDVNESYDAPDFQNMALALQTVTPRSQGRVVQGTSASNVTLGATDPTLDPNQFLRLDLEDLPLPSFHRPDLANYWFNWLLYTLRNSPFNMQQQDEVAAAILDPYPNGTLRSGLSADVAALITAIKRKVSLRPLREDNPHFDGGNPMSVVNGLPTKITIKTGVDPKTNKDVYGIAIPYWEAVGPWDVDNDNDGVPDSIWVDVGNPVQVAADGTRYKALVSYLIVDLDSRLNVNAHGLADDILPAKLDPTKANFFDPTQTFTGSPGNLAHVAAAGAISSTLQLPRGLGYGPAESSLRPLFPAPLDASGNPIYGNRIETIGSFAPVDDYAAILRGRILQDGGAVFGKYGLDQNTNGTAATAGTNYAYAKLAANSVPVTSPANFTGERAMPGLVAQLKFFDYPWSSLQVYPWIIPLPGNSLSAFGNAPDLKARYALGLDYTGQPVYEVRWDVNPNNTTLPFNLLAKSPYELDLNSAQRRDHWGVDNYADATTAFNSTVDFSFSGGQSGLSDDAPFSTTDLEKVLRAWDADAGTLPSRLWDCVSAFDPLKLSNVEYGDPYRVVKFTNAAFGLNLTNPPNTTDPKYASYLATAQQIAGINRRLVTTDSYDLPVAGGTVPNQAALAVGPDGQPGRAGIDDDPDGTGPQSKDGNIDDPSEIGAPDTDDFKAIVGKEPARATIADLLQYRIWTEARRFEMRRQGLAEVDLANLNAADYAKFLNMVNTRAQAVLTQSPQLLSDLIAPEVIGGNRMDLNRPFGDGRDNNGDGVVDDPLEAGDPFLDMDGNGKWDSGEPFIDLGGDGYTPPGDHMWSDLTVNGTLGEQIGFDYTNGQATRIHAVLANALKNIGGARNLESQGRQLFARHLYCLMLLLVDENYIAPWDENDPQVMTWIETERTKLTGATPAISTPEADYIVKRKLTCRMIAQWAVNCVDMRDADVIMTPFEYDEDPWDGWGVWNDSWMGDITQSTVVNKLSFLPLDGDVATDENKGEVIDWPNVPKAPNPNTKKLTTLPAADIPTHPLDQTRGFVWGAERPELLITEALAFHDRRTEDDQSVNPNGHDTLSGTSSTRYKDVDLDQGLRPRGSAFVELYNPWSEQGQRPAELYNRVDVSTGYVPTADPTGKQGVDLGRLSNLAWDDGNKRLTLAATNSANKIKRSPVWRMVVVEEWPDARSIGDNLGEVGDDVRGHADLKLPAGFSEQSSYRKFYSKLAADYGNRPKTPAAYDGYAANLEKAVPWQPPRWVPTNPDFDLLFGSDMIQTTDTNGKPETRMIGPAYGTNGLLKQIGSNNQFYISYPAIEREFYFTTDKSPVIYDATTKEYDWDFTQNRDKFNLRIPDRSISIKLKNLKSDLLLPAILVQTQKFIPPYLERSSLDKPVLTPIMPGHYGVVGSAGTNYDFDPKDPFNPSKQIYTTTIGRNDKGGPNLDDTSHDVDVHLHRVRRIEMHPSWAPQNPLQQQLLVGSNGGDPKDEIRTKVKEYLYQRYDPYAQDIARNNELINDQGTVKNIADAAGTGTPNDNYYLPAVTIPVEGMNISEPPWGYRPREIEAALEEKAIQQKNQIGGATAPDLTFKRTSKPSANGTVGSLEGRYFSHNADGTENDSSYDKPFDTAPELMRTGTTANYRMIHLQRLANPLLPWNPPPVLADGKTPNPEHRANLPINPYLTVDSSSVNLTAFNGTSSREDVIKDPKNLNSPSVSVQKEQGKMRPWVGTELDNYLNSYKTGGKVADLLASKKKYRVRQIWSFRSLERGATARWNYLGSNAAASAFEPQRVLWAQEPAQTTLINPPSKPATPEPELSGLIVSRRFTTAFNEVPTPVQTDQKILKNYCNMVLEHSLGFSNESYGLAYTRADAPTVAAVGAPKPSRFLFTHNVDPATGNYPVGTPPTVDSTNPWFAWNNRPYVSAEELMNVPAGSQATMLRMYSALDPNKAANNTPNTYGLAQLGTPAALTLQLNATRFAVMQAPFGQMLNVFAASVFPAGYANGTGDIIPYGAPNFYRILDYVQVPSRFVGTDTMLNAETFNDVPAYVSAEPIGTDITSPDDPRYSFQPPFNKVSRERDPGRVNLNTVTGRRIPPTSTTAAQIWSEVYDGIMHRVRDANPSANVLGQPGPAWRDVVLSRRGYAQYNADKPNDPFASVEKLSGTPDVFEFGLNPSFPTVFANPFRSADAGDLVPLAQMMQFGVDASLLRKHPYDRAQDSNKVWQPWGPSPMNFGDARDAGYGAKETVSTRVPSGAVPGGTIPNDDPSKRDILPLFSEKRDTPYSDSDRNPYNMYQPMTRLGNLVTDRSNVYAVWITIGYFEVEPAPNWNDPDANKKTSVRQRFGATNNDTDAETVAGLALYNRVYPEGYMLGRELGSDTGDVTRPRGFYIIDRSEPVGFKPGEDLNVEKAIRLRRRIE